VVRFASQLEHHPRPACAAGWSVGDARFPASLLSLSLPCHWSVPICLHAPRRRACAAFSLRRVRLPALGERAGPTSPPSPRPPLPVRQRAVPSIGSSHLPHLAAPPLPRCSSASSTTGCGAVPPSRAWRALRLQCRAAKSVTPLCEPADGRAPRPAQTEPEEWLRSTQRATGRVHTGLHFAGGPRYGNLAFIFAHDIIVQNRSLAGCRRLKACRPRCQLRSASLPYPACAPNTTLRLVCGGQPLPSEEACALSDVPHEPTGTTQVCPEVHLGVVAHRLLRADSAGVTGARRPNLEAAKQVCH